MHYKLIKNIMSLFFVLPNYLIIILGLQNTNNKQIGENESSFSCEYFRVSYSESNSYL